MRQEDQPRNISRPPSWTVRRLGQVFLHAAVFVAVAAAANGTVSLVAAEEPAKPEPEKSPYRVKKDSTVALFDGKTLAGWKKTEFGGEGDVTVKDGQLRLDFGASMTGITYAGKRKLPTTNYELTLQAMRVDGSDFFCGLTFPVGKSHCSFVCGGWGGGVVGLSSIDYYDASENETTTYRDFKSKQWYQIRVRVTDEAIQCWIGGEQVVDQKLEGHKVDTRIEMDLCKPLGVATWETSAALKDFKLALLEKVN
jgi:hypothetical protein